MTTPEAGIVNDGETTSSCTIKLVAGPAPLLLLACAVSVLVPGTSGTSADQAVLIDEGLVTVTGKAAPPFTVNVI